MEPGSWAELFSKGRRQRSLLSKAPSSVALTLWILTLASSALDKPGVFYLLVCLLGYFLFVCLFVSCIPRLASLNSLSNQGWPWTSDLPVNTSRVLGLQCEPPNPVYILLASEPSMLGKDSTHQATSPALSLCFCLVGYLVFLPLSSLSLLNYLEHCTSMLHWPVASRTKPKMWKIDRRVGSQWILRPSGDP